MKIRALVSSFLLAAVSIGAVSSRLQAGAAPSQLPESALQLTPSEIKIYQSTETLIDWTPKQIHECPFLRKLRRASSQHELPMILDRVGQTGALLLNDFPQISCVEEVHTYAESAQASSEEQFTGDWEQKQAHNAMRQAMLPPFPPQDRKFRYIVIPRTKGGLPGFEEYRTDLNGSSLGIASLNGIFMITSNFVSTGLYLTAAHQPDTSFRHFGMDTIRKRQCHVVGFAQSPERVRAVGLISVRGKTAALLVQGLAWIDSETFQVLRVTTWLLAPRGDIGLNSSISTVDFFPVQPTGTERTLWLPRDVTVQGVYAGVTFHNTHHYFDFKLFRVESTIKPEE